MSQKDNYAHLSFNRGLLSVLGLGRLDLKRTALSAEIQTNWVPRVLGSAMLRPGFAYKGNTKDNAAAVHIPFVFSSSDKAVLEFTANIMRIRIDDVILTRPSVSSAVTNGNFATDITTGWTDSDEVGAVSSYSALNGGSLAMLGNSTGTAFCRQDQQVTVAVGDQGIEHALRIAIGRGPLEIKVGSTQGGQEYFGYSLGTGSHSLSFTPTGNFWIRIRSRESYTVLLGDINVESSGNVEIGTDREDLSILRFDQSGDIIFIACKDKPQTKVERRSTRSWSWVIYEANQGPFLIQNLGATTILPNGLNGDVTLTASSSIFESGHVGALFSVTSNIQNVSADNVASEDTFTDPILVTGITDTRIFTIEISDLALLGTQTVESNNIAAENTFTTAITVEGDGDARIFSIVVSDLSDSTVTLQKSTVSATGPWTDVTDWTADTSEDYDDGLDSQTVYYRIGVKTGDYGTDTADVSLLIESGATVTLQRSISAPGTWSDVKDWTVDTIETFDDGLDNQTVYYRIGVKTGDYGSGTPDISLLIEAGFITGICRITAVASDVSASAITLENFGSSTVASSDWSEGRWSGKRGHPTAVAFHEGRLFWAGKDRLNGSVSDSFYNYDPDYEGDAAPINRSIGQGPVDNINWLSSGKTLLMGCEGSIKSVRSSNLDEPLTKSNTTIKDIVTQGTAAVDAVKIDKQVVFVQASGVRVYDVGFDSVAYDYGNIDLTAIVPEVGKPSIIKVVVQRQPDTRAHCVRSDGTVALLIYDKVEDVKCWILVTTPGATGLVEDALVLPGTIEDEVYYLVNRTIGGVTKRFWEKWTHESENKGSTITKLADSHIIYSGVSTATITGLGHFEGESVVVWGNSKDLGTYTVASDQITLTEATTWCCVGLTYSADFKSAKPALATPHGSSLLQKKMISQLGLLLADTHAKGLIYGPDFDNLDDLPAREDGAIVDGDQMLTAYDEEAFSFPGIWDTDARVCLRATAPRPCTLLALVVDWNTNEKV